MAANADPHDPLTSSIMSLPMKRYVCMCVCVDICVCMYVTVFIMKNRPGMYSMCIIYLAICIPILMYT